MRIEGEFMTPSTPTLYDDWLARRERLAEAGGGEADWRAVELRLLGLPSAALPGLAGGRPAGPVPAAPAACSSTIGRLSSIITSAGA